MKYALLLFTISLVFAEQPPLATPLSADEERALMVQLIEAQNARIRTLETLQAEQQASVTYLNDQKALAAKHAACEGGAWDFKGRKWTCPAPKAAPVQ